MFQMTPFQAAAHTSVVSLPSWALTSLFLPRATALQEDAASPLLRQHRNIRIQGPPAPGTSIAILQNKTFQRTQCEGQGDILHGRMRQVRLVGRV